MDTDTDLIGIIAASCVMSLFIIGLTVVLARVCHKRMERMRRKKLMKDIRDRQLEAEPIYELLSVGGPSDVASQVPRRMSIYRPKILSEEEETALQGHLSRINSRETGRTHRQKHTAKYSHNKHDSPESENDVSIIYIDDSDDNSKYTYDGREITSNGFITQRFVINPHRNNTVGQTKDKNFLEHREHQQHVQGIMKQNTYNDSKPGRVVSPSERDDVGGGQVTMHTVVMSADGQLTLAKSGQKGVNGVVSHHQKQGEVHFPVTSVDVDNASGYITRSPAKSGSSMAFSLSSNKANDNELIREDIRTVKTTSVENSRPDIIISKVKDNTDGEQLWDTSQKANHAGRQVHNLLSSHEEHDDGWEADDDEDVVKYKKVHKQEDDTSTKRQEDSISIFYSDSKNYKVIKKYSSHNKPPDWLVQTYAEAAAGVDDVESSLQVARSVDTVPVTYRRKELEMGFSEASLDIEDEDVPSVRDLNLAHPAPDYPQEEELYTIVDYVDYDSGDVGRSAALTRLVV